MYFSYRIATFASLSEKGEGGGGSCGTVSQHVEGGGPNESTLTPGEAIVTSPNRDGSDRRNSNMVSDRGSNSNVAYSI